MTPEPVTDPAVGAGDNSERKRKDRAGTARRELMENEIYAQALRLFSERGYEATTLQDIADALDLTRPALYYYVKSKESLLSRLVAETAEEAVHEIRAVRARDDIGPAEKIRSIARFTARIRAQQSDRFLLLDRSEGSLPAPIAEAYLQARRSVLRDVTEVIQEGVRLGDFLPVNERVAALSFIGMCNWVAWWFREDRDGPADRLADDVAELAVRTLLRPTGTAAASGPLGALTALRHNVEVLERMLSDGSSTTSKS